MFAGHSSARLISIRVTPTNTGDNRLKMICKAYLVFFNVAAFAVMSNHYHLMLFVDPDEQKPATARDIVE